MTIAVITANLGNFDPQIDYVDQSLPYDFYRFTDANFPPRICSMTPRLQARIVKIFGWQMVPPHDYYLWIDSSCILSHHDSLKWFIDHCKGADMAVFKHNERNTIQQEADFLKTKLAQNSKYLTPRYKNELIDEQLSAIHANKTFIDDKLFATTALIYKNTLTVRNVMFHWWYHTSRFHSIDQLSLPFVLFEQKCPFNIIPYDYLKIPYLEHIRKRKNKHATISFIIPTVGRPSLQKTIDSIEKWPGDEVLVIQHTPPSGNWGNAERQEGTDKTKCDYLAYIDDDDVYVKGHRAIMDQAIRENPNGNPILFKIKYPNGRILWEKKWVKNGNVSTQMILVKNNKSMLYHWDQQHTWADFQFINRWQWPAKSIDWRNEVLVLMGHNDEKHEQKLTFLAARQKGILK